MSFYNLNEYKKAKVMVKELDKVVKILDATHASLLNYKRYAAVQRILTTIHEYKPLLEIALEQTKITLETKGERRRG